MRRLRISAAIAGGAVLTVLAACTSTPAGPATSVTSTPGTTASAGPASTGPAASDSAAPTTSSAPAVTTTTSPTTTPTTTTPTTTAPPAPIRLTVMTDGSDAAMTAWLTRYVVPGFTRTQAAAGHPVEITVRNGKAASYRADLTSAIAGGTGPDVFAVDDTLLGDLARTGYLHPLDDVVGDPSTGWDGWAKIPDSVKSAVTVDDKAYGVPLQADTGVLYYNKKLFARAKLPTNWQPTSWQDVITAGQKLATVEGVTPVQIDGGAAMGEDAAVLGILPLLAGTGASLFTDGKWLGNTPQLRQVLTFYDTLYNKSGLGDAVWQLDPGAKDDSRAAFAAGTVGILADSDRVWADVLDPKAGSAKMATRDKDVGYALMPAMTKTSGPGGTASAAVATGSALAIDPTTSEPALAWDLIEFMTTPAAITALLGRNPAITARTDVNATALAKSPVLRFAATKALPQAVFRPGSGQYPAVSLALRQATADVVAGTSVADAAARYQTALEKIVGKANITTG